MKAVKTLSGKELSWLGIGCYGIGGVGHRNVELSEQKADKTYLEALENQFQIGYNFSEIALGYGHGNASRLFAQAIKNSSVNRSDLFLTNSVYPRDFSSFAEVKGDVDEMYSVFETDYFDSTLITQSLTVKYGYGKVIETLNDLLSHDRTRYVSLSNAGKKFITKFKKEFGDKVFAHETHLSFEVRINQDEGIFDLCDELKIGNIIWRPLRRNETAIRSWDLLTELAKKYGKTQNQIILNWMNHLRYRPMVMSSSKNHIGENWNAKDFKMEDSDYEKINNFRVPNLQVPEIDWEKTGDGIGMADFVFGFDEYYKK